MKVIVVMGSLYPEQLDLWRACRDAGADVLVVGGDVATSAIWDWRPRRADDLPTELLSPRRLVPARGHLWWWYPSLFRLVNSTKPDVLHVCSEPWGLLVIESVLAAGRSSMKPAVCAHGADNIIGHGAWAERGVRQQVLRATLPKLAGLAGWTEEVIELCRGLGLPSTTPTVVVPAEVPDASRFRPATGGERDRIRSRWGLPAGDRIVGFVGRLVPEKGVMDLLQAVRSVPGSGVFTAVWGAGPLEHSVRDFFDRHLARGAYLGVAEPRRIPEVLRACDILAVPSRRTVTWKEQFGRVAVEGSLSGCAIVAYSSGSLSDVLRSGAILVEEGDVPGLSAAIRRLVANPEEARMMAQTGVAAARARFDLRHLARQMLGFWEEIST